MAPDSRLLFSLAHLEHFFALNFLRSRKGLQARSSERSQLLPAGSPVHQQEAGSSLAFRVWRPVKQSLESRCSRPAAHPASIGRTPPLSPSSSSNSSSFILSPIIHSEPHQMESTNVSHPTVRLDLCRVNNSGCFHSRKLPCKNSNRNDGLQNRVFSLLSAVYLLIRFTVFSVVESSLCSILHVVKIYLNNIKKFTKVSLKRKSSSAIQHFNRCFRLNHHHLIKNSQTPTKCNNHFGSRSRVVVSNTQSSGQFTSTVRSPPFVSAKNNIAHRAHYTKPCTSPPLISSTSVSSSSSFSSSSSLSQSSSLSSSVALSSSSSLSRSLVESTILVRRSSFTWWWWCPRLLGAAVCLRRKEWKCSLSRWPHWQYVILLLACLPKDASAGQHERRLLSDLLGNYNPLERPVANESEPVQVSFGITLQQIIDVDEKNQLLITNTWLKLEWNDVNLQWNESDYGNVKDLRIPPYKIWKPDVLMYNSADEGFDGTYQTKVVVSSNGNCLYIPPGIFKSTCKIDITWFPFDDQKCKMKFGSWTYSGWQLDLQLQNEEGGDLSDFIKNGEWDLIGCPGKRNAIYYQCCPEPYVDVTFEIMIRRRTLYYFCNLILPCVLIASMAVLGFTLPPDCGEKLSLGVAVLLSLCVFSELVNNTLPQTSDAVPLLGTYFNCIMFMVASSVVSTVLILNYHHRSADTHQMSPMVKSMFLQWLPWVLRMHRPGEKITRKTIMMNNKMKELELKCPASFQERSSKSLLANVLDIDDDFRAHTLPHPGHNTNNSTMPGGIIRIPHSGHSVDDSHLVHTCMSQCTRELNLILKEVRVITDKMRKEDEELEVTNDWRFAAMVVDRMCLIVFTLFTVTATVAVLLSAPHIMS